MKEYILFAVLYVKKTGPVPKTIFRPRQGWAKLTVLSVSAAQSLGRPANVFPCTGPTIYM